MLKGLRASKKVQLAVGLLIGLAFGFLLQKGGVTSYDVILGQLLLQDFTVVKVMLSAVIVGMVGVHMLVTLGLAEMHPKAGSLGGTAVGALIFGVGFGLLGYCPGTIAGAVGNGSLDALFGGLTGALIGAGLFASLYPALEGRVLHRGDFGDVTLPRLLKVRPWLLVAPMAAALGLLLVVVERAGL